MKRNGVAILVVAGAMAFGGWRAAHAQDEQAAVPAGGEPGYDAFMALDQGERVRVFNEATPEKKSELVGTHVQRWRAANLRRLDQEQIGVLEAHVALMTADFFRSPRGEERAAAAQRLAERARKAFSDDDLREALTIHGSPVPEVP